MAEFLSWGNKPVDPAQNTYVLTHGLLNSADPPEAWLVEMANGIKARDPNANIILTKWDTSNPLLYPVYAAQTNFAGNELAHFLVNNKLNPQKITLIGHSLGAHLSGAAGRDYRALTGTPLNLIVGLDPAGPMFEQNFTGTFRLDPTDAARVVGIHTSKTFGYDFPLGHLDVFPNSNNLLQPGATNAIDNHGYATTLFNELLRGKTYPGLSLDTLLSNQTGMQAVATDGSGRSLTYFDPIQSALGFLWNSKNSQYQYVENSNLVSREAVQALSRSRIEAAKREIQQITADFLAGRLPFEEWQRRMTEIIKLAHIEQALLGRGGVDAMTQQDYASTQQTIQTENQFLQNFAREIASGNLTKKQIAARANLYAQRSRLSGETAIQQNYRDRGYLYMQRFLGAADKHCPDCPRYSALGVQPVGTLPLPTEQCQCRANCKCSVKYYQTLAEAI